MRSRGIAMMAALLALTSVACGDKDNPVLAKFNDGEIRAQDYFEQVRHISAEFRPDLSDPQVREDFLRTLIQKDLLLQEAKSLGIDDDPIFKSRVEERHRAIAEPAIREALRKDRPNPDPQVIEKLADLISYRYHLRAIQTETEDEIRPLYQRLENGEPWDKVAKVWIDGDERKRDDQGWRQLDFFPRAHREAVAPLEVGQHSGVIETDGVYYIWYLEEKQKIEEVERSRFLDKANEMWGKDWDDVAFAQFMENARQKLDYHENDEFLGEVAARFRQAAPEGQRPGNTDESWPTFSPSELRTEVASWQGGGVTLDDLQFYIHQIPTFFRPDLGKVETFKGQLGTVASNRIILQELKEMDIPISDEVAWSMERVVEQRLLRRARGQLVADATVTEEETRAFYDQHNTEFKGPGEYLVRIAVIPTKEKADSLYNLMLSPPRFAEQAKKHSTHQSAKKGGELGWLKPHDIEELYPILRTAELRRTTEPVPGLGGYVMLRVEDTRGERELTYDEAKDYCHNTLMEAAQDSVLTAWLQKRFDEEVKMYPERLASLTIPEDLRATAAKEEPAPGDSTSAPAGAGETG